MVEWTEQRGIGDTLLEEFEGQPFSLQQAAEALGYSLSWTRQLLYRHEDQEFLGTKITKAGRNRWTVCAT